MLLTFIVFFILLSILVMVHEIGHFVAAKKFGIKVEEFGFGLPPRIWGKKVGETIYSINWLPIGGFVKLYGEDAPSHEKVSQAHRAFFTRPAWQRSIVLIAGVTMNFLLAVCIITYLFTQGVMTPAKRIHIEAVSPGSPAAIAGLQQNDILVAVNGTPIDTSKKFQEMIQEYQGKEVSLDISRGASLIHYREVDTSCLSCERVTVSLTPRKNPPERPIPASHWFTDVKNTVRRVFGLSDLPAPKALREGPIGIEISSLERVWYPVYEAPIVGLKESVIVSWNLVQGIGMTLWKLVSLQPVAKDVAGPLGIAQMTGEAIKFGWRAVLDLMGLLSLNLAIVNILPIPALDGGRLMFVIIETITGKKVKEDVERYAHQVGMIVLLALILLVTVNDVVRIFGK